MGPCQFAEGVDGSDGRSVTVPGISRDEFTYFWLGLTSPPAWGEDPASWRLRYDQAPIRLLAECRLAGHDAWQVPLEVRRTSEG
jgi:hypothetical protein